MHVRRSLVMGLAVAGALGATVGLAAPDALAGSGQAAPSQQTHPGVRPRVGHRHTRFGLTFTLAQAPVRAGLIGTYYRELVSPPGHAPASCSPAQPAPVVSGAQGATVKLALRPPAAGWCRGRYDVTVFLQHTPSCGPPLLQVAPLIVCPMLTQPEPAFPINELDTGQAHFTVR